MSVEQPIDERSPMCMRVLDGIKAFHACYGAQPEYWCVPANIFNIMLLELEQASGERHLGISLCGVPIQVFEMHQNFERTTQRLH